MGKHTKHSQADLYRIALANGFVDDLKQEQTVEHSVEHMNELGDEARERLRSMSVDSRRFCVKDQDNFYGEMVGTLVFETPKSYLLEYKLNDFLGGTHRVMFFKEQVYEYGNGDD